MHRVSKLTTQVASGKQEPYGGQLAGTVIREAGVKAVFTLTGGHIAPILVGCNSLGVRVVDVRDEATAVFAADAYSRLSGVPGVAVVTAGPGLTNTITAVKNAQLAESSVLILAGATSTLLKGRGSLQDIDQMQLMKHHCKCQFTIKYVRQIVPILKQAFRKSIEGVPGPVFVEFPLDTIWPLSEVRSGILKGAKTAPKVSSIQDISPWIQYQYLNHHLRNVFQDAFTENRSMAKFTLEPQNSKTTFSSMLHIRDSLQRCSRPVFLIGSQAIKSSKTKIDRLVLSLEKLAIPVYLSGMARGLLGKSHSLQMRHSRGNALKKADWVCFAGVPTDFRVDYGRQVAPNAVFVMANLSSQTLSKNSDIRSRSYSVLGEPHQFIVQLASAMGTSPDKWATWRRILRESDEKRDKEISEMSRTRTFGLAGNDSSRFVNPVRLCTELDSVLADDSIIVADGGDFVGTASYIVKPRKPLSWLDPGVFGTLGVGGGFAIASKVLYPNSEVWIVFGDGACGWSLAEIDTMVRMKLPIIMVIGNDACWMQMHRDQVRLLKDPVATNLNYTRYDQVAKGLGAEGLLVDSDEKIHETLLKAKSIAKTGKPVVVNAMLFKSNFREGSISL